MRYRFANCVLALDSRELIRGSDVVDLAPQVFDLLAYLIRHRERVVGKDELVDAIWDGRAVSDAALTTRVYVARAAIGDSGRRQRLIKTVARRGLRFVAQVEEIQERTDIGATARVTASSIALPPRPQEPSIRGHGFGQVSQDRGSATLAELMTTDVRVALTRLRWLEVVTDGENAPGCRYLLRGSVGRLGARCRITAEVVDAARGVNI